MLTTAGLTFLTALTTGVSLDCPNDDTDGASAKSSEKRTIVLLICMVNFV